MRKDLITKVLKEDTVVNARLSTSSIWMPNIVYKVENQLVYIGLLNEYLENIIMIGQKMFLKTSNSQTEFLFEGDIAKISPDFPSYVAIEIKTIRKLKNTRSSPRHDVYLGALVKPSKTGEEVFSIAHNISLNGMAFYSRSDLAVDNQQIDVWIRLPNSKTIKTRGKVKRMSIKEHFSDYGFQYTELDNESKTLLSNFFNCLEKEKTKLREEFSNNIKKHL
ncbi:MAG: PilZ domain-containing protein [Clostridium sp.]|nr:PilZ domain-containing protein [Clostridium sp.]